MAGAPEDEHRVLAGVEQLMATAQHPLHAGVGDDSQGGASAYISAVSPGCGRVVHANYALGPVDLLSPASTDEVARAGDQGAGVAVHLKRLMIDDADVSLEGRQVRLRRVDGGFWGPLQMFMLSDAGVVSVPGRTVEIPIVHQEQAAAQEEDEKHSYPMAHRCLHFAARCLIVAAQCV